MYDNEESFVKNDGQTIDEVELKFEFPITTAENLNYFLESLNDKHYRDVMVRSHQCLIGLKIMLIFRFYS